MVMLNCELRVGNLIYKITKMVKDDIYRLLKPYVRAAVNVDELAGTLSGDENTDKPSQGKPTKTAGNPQEDSGPTYDINSGGDVETTTESQPDATEETDKPADEQPIG